MWSGPSARDLSRMFPTPPSAEMPCSSISSPMQAAETVTAEAVAVDTLHPHHFTSSTSALTSGRDDGAGTVGSLVLRKVMLLYVITLHRCVLSFVYLSCPSVCRHNNSCTSIDVDRT